MPKKTIQIIVASTRPTRAGLPVGRWVYEQAQALDAWNVELVDLAEVNLPLLDEPEMPSSGNYQQEHTKRWSKLISRGDGYIIVMPEYNHSYSAPLKNALDTLYSEWDSKPVALVGYSNGSVAGNRAVEHLIPVLHCLNMKIVHAKVNLAKVTVANDQPYDAPEGAQKALQSLFTELTQALA